MIRHAIATFAILASLAGSVLADDKPTGDAAKFQGSWNGIGGPNKDTPFVVTFEGKKATLAFEVQGQSVKVEGEFKLDEKATPKRIDWTKFTDPSGNAIAENLGIYKLEDNKLTLCSGGPGNERPSEFKAGDAGAPPNLQVITRVDDKKADETIKGELAKFQGKWKTKLGELDITLEIKGQKVTANFTNDGKEMKLEGEIVVNDSLTPKGVDFVKFHGINGDDMQDNLGIYTIDKDTITICLGGPGNSRPSEFKSGDNGQSLLTLEKVK